MQIAIDGPAGAGKSTVARLIAARLGFIYIDTGAMYRALTWKALAGEVDLEDEKRLAELAQSTDINFVATAEGQNVICDGADISAAIRSPRVNTYVSRVAALPQVREVMVKKQQVMARCANVVMDGRDIGEYVLPEADFKFYITASIDERTRRRIREMDQQGFTTDENSLRQQLEQRDQMDQTREMGALKILADAKVIDTSSLSIDEVLNLLLEIIGET